MADCDKPTACERSPSVSLRAFIAARIWGPVSTLIAVVVVDNFLLGLQCKVCFACIICLDCTYCSNHCNNYNGNMHTNVSKTKVAETAKKIYTSWLLPEERDMLRAIAKRRGQTMSRVEADLIRAAYAKEFRR